MRDHNGVLLSVRGEARQMVPPNSAVLEGRLTATEDGKSLALGLVAELQEQFSAGLRELGAVPYAVDTVREPLTWSVHSTTTQEEYAIDPRTERHGPTGRITASCAVTIRIRDLGLLDTVGSALAGVEAMSVDSVSWQVDADNAAWGQVRSAAIQAAIQKGRDYALALGGTLDRVEHIADVGLLGGSDSESELHLGVASRFAGGAMERGDAPTLDPVPQEIVALIEARFVASVTPLGRD